MTIKNIERYKSDLEKLVMDGSQLLWAMQHECYPKDFRSQLETLFKKDEGEKKKSIDTIIKNLPRFSNRYQMWYSESHSLVRQLLPDRLADFTALYEKPKNRKELNHGNYVIADYLQGLIVKQFGEKIIGEASAIPQFEQQLNIVQAVKKRFESSLFDIKQLLQADLFDSELDAARELLKKKFNRAAGAIAGVVLEGHLQEVCNVRNIKVPKNATIAVFNDALKTEGAIELPQWRFIQHLADLRNMCDHKRGGGGGGGGGQTLLKIRLQTFSMA